MKIILILNGAAGTLRTLDSDAVGQTLADTFRAHGHEVEATVLHGGDAVEAVRKACQGGWAEAVVVGGGDGTISAAAAIAVESGVTLGVLPLGTMNLFARALAIPLEMNAAAEALASGERVDVDIAEVNGHPFVHLISVGVHAQMIRARERQASYGSRLGKMWASAMSAWMVIRQPPRIAASIRVDGAEPRRLRTAAILVSNNPLGDGHALPYADDPRQGQLGLYVLKSRRPADIMKMLFHLALGRVSTNEHLHMWKPEAVDIALTRGEVNASIDGEIVKLQTPLRCIIKRGGLSVLKPRA